MMLVLYFKNYKASFQENKFFLEGISAKHLDWSKAQIVQYLGLDAKNEKIRVLYFLEL